MAQRLTGRFQTRPMAAINLTPLVPVLLAVFAVIVIAGGMGPSRNLPLAAEPVDPPPCNECPPRPHVISVQRGGVVYLDEQTVSLTDLERRLRGSDRNSAEVLVRADADVPYAQAFEAVQAVKRAGLRARLINEDLH